MSKCLNQALCFTAPIGNAYSQEARRSSVPFHSSTTSLDTACAATVALIILSVLRRSRRKAFRRAFGRARQVFSPRFLGHLSTLVQSTPRCFRARLPGLPHLAANAFDPLSPELSPVSPKLMRRCSSQRFRRPTESMLPIQRRAHTASAKLLSSLKPKMEELETQSSESESETELSKRKLGELYDSLTFEGPADVSAMHLAASKLKAHGLDLQPSDGQRLHAMLSDGHSVSRERFVEGVFDLEVAARHVERQQLSLAQLRVVLQSAFERLDADGNGAISVEEFTVALKQFGVALAPCHAALLLRFLGGKEGVAREHLARQPLEAAQTALQGAQQRLAETTGWNGAREMADRLKEAVHQGDFMKIFERQELLADTTELATSLAAMVLLLHELQPHLAGAQLQDMADSVRQLWQSSPMSSMLCSALLAALNAIRSTEVVPLTEDEALLYARFFHLKGCAIGGFRKLLACGGRWRRASEGALDEEETVKILVRGAASCVIDGVETAVKPGCILPNGAVALEEVTYMAWDQVKLEEDVRSSQDPELLKMLPLFQIELEGSPSGSPSEPVAAALHLQAKRKGLRSVGFLTQGFKQIISSDSSCLEKLEKCQKLIMESSCDLVDSLEALVDMAGACSACLALSSHSTSAPDEWLQLTPLLILLSLILGQVIRHNKLATSP